MQRLKCDNVALLPGWRQHAPPGERSRAVEATIPSPPTFPPPPAVELSSMHNFWTVWHTCWREKNRCLRPPHSLLSVSRRTTAKRASTTASSSPASKSGSSGSSFPASSASKKIHPNHVPDVLHRHPVVESPPPYPAAYGFLALSAQRSQWRRSAHVAHHCRKFALA